MTIQKPPIIQNYTNTIPTIPPTNMKIIHLKHLKQVFQFVEPPTNTLLRNPLKFETPRAFHHYPSSKTCSQVTKTQQDRDT